MNLASFSKFSAMHALVVVVLALATAGLVAAARRLDPAGRRRLRITMGLTALLVQAVHNGYWLLFREGSGNELPLHICDLSGLIATAAFLWPYRPLRALLYFWGIGLSSLAFIIPVLTAGPASFEFWSFWMSHWVIVGGAIYMILAEGYRPTRRDMLLAVGVLVGYGLIMTPMNIACGTNYGYTGPDSPPTAFAGPWPLPRLPLLVLAVVVLHAAVYLPWVLPGLRHRGDRAEPAR
jgi:hypothetical integral membrane protein (TIGR02206 family)